ncbi:M23 family metallopeptidase [Steroidobacter sp. S1-65]|uniref:M23 family metallopeptidase n=1 Tax=Steroidobacter gossypii TaxID=2805490 RepID=A0ABS1WYA0_9GAMM|nr:M23 family metallopeptidase [Steroidobacter gossypii]MBM0105943.1 M23 family metallopeptidase [Steroidobacter gossypii]
MTSSASVVVLVMLAWFAPLDQAAASQQRARLVQSVDIQIPSAPTPVTIAGARHLAYELHITNFRPVDVVLKRLEILDAGRDSRVAEFSDSQLAARLDRVGARVADAERQIIPPGGRTIIYLWLPLEDRSAIPARLQHRIELDLMRSSGREHAVITDSGCAVRGEQPVVLNAPLRGGPWVALYDPLMVGGHRTSVYTLNGRARIPARFAIDWVKLGDDATRARGDVNSIRNWHGYGAEVLAVADGVIAEAVDDMTEGATLSEATGPLALENASGNYVTLDLGGGRYAFYEHLQHGSIAVKRGDRVKSGQVLGRLGNSGSSSSGPHLHFHVADAEAELAAEGLPYVFSGFEVVGAYDDIHTFATGEPWKSSSLPAAARKRSRELPGANTVIVFPELKR